MANETKYAEREQFEDWYSDGIRGQLKRNESGQYLRPETEEAWQIWQAARAETVREIVGKLLARADQYRAHESGSREPAVELECFSAELEAEIRPAKG